MLKSFFLKALRLIVLILVLVQINFNTVLAQEIQSTNDVNPPSPTVQQEEVKTPNRPQTTTEEEITATPNQQEQTPIPSSRLSNTNRPQDPYAKYYDSMKQFNTEIYGDS